jgi:hypothetical protein
LFPSTLRATAILNPRVIAVLNPRVTAILNPRVTVVLNPRVTAILNPRVTAILNPRVTVVLNPRVTVVLDQATFASVISQASTPLLQETVGELCGLIVNAPEKALLSVWLLLGVGAGHGVDSEPGDAGTTAGRGGGDRKPDPEGTKTS